MHNDKKYQIEKVKEEFNLCSLDTKLEFASYLVTTPYYHLLSIAILFSEENSEVLNFFPTKPQINVQTLTFPKMVGNRISPLTNLDLRQNVQTINPPAAAS